MSGIICYARRISSEALLQTYENRVGPRLRHPAGLFKNKVLPIGSTG